LALGGGLIFGSIMNILPEVPPKNIVTMFDAARKYGRYPIQIA
jgi:uroporphyrinogen decarboxylase